jgi:hypothetical protein
MKKALLVSTLFPLIVLKSAYAWENHALCSTVALSVLSDVKKLPEVTAESLESFLQAEKAALTLLLDEEEDWARHQVPNYPFRPEKLRFDASENFADLKELKLKFLSAIRVNPLMKLPLFVQEIPGFESKPRPKLAAEEITLLPKDLSPLKDRFVSLNEGEKIDPLSIIATASDEPDYGLDIHLWENNPSEFGKAYQFGNQPFGNPVLDFSSQAPFHMGFFHESALAYKAASYLTKTYPEYRIHMYMSLARFAIKTGHPYWGFRFAGWGLHYIGDLTQPYHSTSLPGVNLMKMLFLGGLDLIGIHGPLVRRVQLVTNEHLALENYEFNSLMKALTQNDPHQPILLALKKSERDSNYNNYSQSYPRDIIAFESNRKAQATHSTLKSSLPPLIVQDSNYLFGITDPQVDVLKIVESSDSKKSQIPMQTMILALMENLGSHTRNFIRAVLGAE